MYRVISTSVSPEAEGGEGRAFSEEAARLPPEDLILKQYEQFRMALQDADAEWVLERYLSSFARAYDPHSDYLTPSAAEDFDIEMKLSLEGIGAVLRAEDGAAKVIRLIPGGPAARDTRDIRLRPGDKIVAVGQGDRPPESILHRPLYKAVRLIRGAKNTRVVLVVIPASDPGGRKIVDLVREEVKLEEQAARLNMYPCLSRDGQACTVGVITVPTFYANPRSEDSEKGERSRGAAADVRRLLQQARDQGAAGIVLDLRGNGGGVLSEAVALSGLFIGCQPVVLVRERGGVKPVLDPDAVPVYEGPLMVLVDRTSASASEIVAAALQDYGRAVIVGDSRTHGKGTVQTLASLGMDPKLGKIKITRWVYYRVTGLPTQVRGVAPDLILPSPFETMDLGEEELSHAIRKEWDPVPPASFVPVSDLKPAIRRLEAFLRDDRLHNPRLAAYQNLLRRLDGINTRAEWPLTINERRELIRLERDMAELQRTFAAEEDDDEQPPPRAEAPDIVLEETLRLMADFVAMGTPPLRWPTIPDHPKGFWDIIHEWWRTWR